MKQPDLRLKKTILQKVFTFAGVIGWLSVAVYISSIFGELPDRVPVHFNLLGNVDSWGHKGFIWIVPLIGFMVWGVLSLMESAPHHFNYLVAITEGNAERQYRNAVLMISVLKTEIMAYLVFTSWQMTQFGSVGEPAKPIWDIPLFLAAIFGTLGVYIYRMIKLK